MSSNYVLRVTAGPSYDFDSQVEVPVNSPQTVKISSELADIELNVRIQDFDGLPRDSPKTSAYFSTEPHAYNKDQYSIAFRYTPKKPSDADAEAGIKATNLQFGNDFDHAIKDRLPPGFSTAMSIVKWWIDPGLDGDAYADKPYLYGPALSSFNAVHVGPGEYDEAKGGLWFDEGGDEAGLAAREALGAPADGKQRMKWALKDDSKESWVFEYGKTYGLDFYNPYLDFSNLALKLPGFQLPIMRYWDGQPLRYVLRNKDTEQTYLVILFTLYHKDYVNDDGSLKPGAQASLHPDVGLADGDEEEVHDADLALREARASFGPKYGEEGYGKTSADDVD